MSGPVLVQFLVLLFFTVITLGSLVVYGWRRRKARLKAVYKKQSRDPVRQLTPREKDILAPLLTDPNAPDRKIALKSENVYHLEGPFSRHGVESLYHATYHNQIAGVEVVLPLDALEYLQGVNTAEVVFADRYAVVISLNDRFDLDSAQEREDLRQAQLDQWEAGKPGRLKSIFPEDEDQQEDPIERVDIMGQRLETAAEAEAREGRGHGLQAAAAWIGAFVALGLSSGASTPAGQQGTLAAAIVLAGLGLWAFWRPYRPGRPGRVNRVRGPFHAWSLADRSQKSGTATQPALGIKLPFFVPDHWFRRLPFREGERIEAEIRVEDRTAVRLADRFSLDAEHLQHPPVYWGKHLTVSIVAVGTIALTALAASDMGNGSLRGDLLLSQAWLSGQPPGHYRSSQALRQDPPGVGTLVELSGKAHCQVQDRPAFTERYFLSCRHLRWDPALAPLAVEPLSDRALALSRGDFLEHRELTSLERLQLGGSAGHGNREIRVVTNPLALIRTVHELCETGDNGSSSSPRGCFSIRMNIHEHLHLNTETPVTAWEDLLELATEAPADGNEPSLLGLITRGNLDLINREVRGFGERMIEPRRRALAEALHDAQAGGVSMHILNATEDDRLPQLGSRQREDRHWQILHRLTTADGAAPFSVSGLVTRAGADSNGYPHYRIDASRSLDEAWPPLMRSLLLLLAVGLLVVHLPLMVSRCVGAVKRARRLRQA